MGMPLASRPLAWATFWLMTGGLILAAIPLVGNAATVLFTFYPPLRAHWAFYLGLTLVVVGTWLVTLNLALTHRAWRARNPETRTPLPAFMAMVTFARRDGDLFQRAAPARADGDARRTMIGASSYLQPEWRPVLALVGIGGTILFLSAMLYFLNMVLTLVTSREPAHEMIPFAEAISGPEHAPAILDRWRPWLALAAALIAIAYGPTLVRLAATTPFNSPGFRVW